MCAGSRTACANFKPLAPASSRCDCKLSAVILTSKEGLGSFPKSDLGVSQELLGSSHKSVTLLRTPHSRALTTRTPFKRTPNFNRSSQLALGQNRPKPAHRNLFPSAVRALALQSSQPLAAEALNVFWGPA